MHRLNVHWSGVLRRSEENVEKFVIPQCSLLRIKASRNAHRTVAKLESHYIGSILVGHRADDLNRPKWC